MAFEDQFVELHHSHYPAHRGEKTHEPASRASKPQHEKQARASGQCDRLVIMPELPIKTLPEIDAVQRIVETVRQAEAGAAPFALVLGAGFSQGLVPTARELVEMSLPLWVKSQDRKETFEELNKRSDTERNLIAREFWEAFVKRNKGRELELALRPDTGLPADNAAAYRAAFNPSYFGAVGAPAQARKFQRRLMRLERPRLNAAHFLLASLMGVQPGQSRASELFKADSAFCRLILTTNFDPFLQIALQAVNRLYFMSDTPELGVSDEILDDQTDSIHLVYLHGSIHHRSQAASDADISALKAKNASILAPVLKRHGVIVLARISHSGGYSGKSWQEASWHELGTPDTVDAGQIRPNQTHRSLQGVQWGRNKLSKIGGPSGPQPSGSELPQHL